MLHVKSHHTLEEIRHFIKKEKKAKKLTRLQAIKKAIEGQSAEQIGQDLSYGAHTIRIWVRRYNRQGLRGLEDSYIPKQFPLPKEEQERFCKMIEAGPNKEEKICAYRGKDVQQILEKEFGKKRTLGAVYYLLHALGYESLMPRPRHYKADREKQDEFKKKCQKGWVRLQQNTLAKRLKSGSRMKRDLGKKER